MRKGKTIFIVGLYCILLISTGTCYADYPDGLVAQWRMNEGSGTVTYDNSGNANNGRVVYGAVWTEGLCGKALFLDGIDDAVTVPPSPKLNFTNAITAEAWLKPARDYRDEPSQWYFSILNKGWAFFLGWTGFVDGWIFGIYDSANNMYNVLAPNLYLDAGKWYHVAGVYDGARLFLYVNGELKAERDIGPIPINPITSWTVIGRTAFTFAFNGIVDELGLWSLALSSDQIKEHYKLKKLHFFDNFESYLGGDVIKNKPQWESSDAYYSKGWTVYETIINGEWRKVINFAPSPWPGGFPLGSNYATYHVCSPKQITSLSLTLQYMIMPSSDMKTYVSGDNNTWIDVSDVIGLLPSPIENDWKSATVDLSGYIGQANIMDDVYVKFTGAAYSGSGWGVQIDKVAVDIECNKPPVVDAGPNIVIDTEDIPYTQINGTAYDPDGDPLTYRWILDAQGTRAVGPEDEAILDLANILREGEHEATLEVSDGQLTASDKMVITVNNSSPIVVIKTAGSFRIGEDIVLRADAADFDGDTLSYKWYEGTTVYDSGEIATNIGGQPVSLQDAVISGGLPLGRHTIVLEVEDGVNLPVVKKSEIEVVDTEAPILAPVAEPSILWPPNHKMVPVTIYANAEDNSGGSISLSTFVMGNESINGDHTEPQIDQSRGIISLQLRSEREGKGTGRTYIITIMATDGSGNTSQAAVEIAAPHDKGEKN